MRALAALALLLAMSDAAIAQERRVAVVTYVDAGLGGHRRALQRGVTRAIGGERLVYHPRRDGECIPTEDPACVEALVRRTGAGDVVYAWLGWERGDCVPMLRDGDVVGHRMLRTAVVGLERYDASGVLVGTTRVEVGDGEDLAERIEAATRALIGE